MDDVLKQTETKMKRTVDLLIKDYSAMRRGQHPLCWRRYLQIIMEHLHLLTRWQQFLCQNLVFW